MAYEMREDRIPAKGVHVVYVVRCMGCLKVGYSNNLATRLRHIQTHAPGPVQLLETLEYSSAPEARHGERYWRNRLQNRYKAQLCGEWVVLPEGTPFRLIERIDRNLTNAPLAPKRNDELTLWRRTKWLARMRALNNCWNA